MPVGKEHYYGLAGGESSYGETVYPYGFDPRWIFAERAHICQLFQMKFAVIVGVGQMTMGIFCKLFNSIHFRDMGIWFECIPQISSWSASSATWTTSFSSSGPPTGTSPSAA